MTAHSIYIGSDRGRETAKRVIDVAPLRSIIKIEPPRRSLPQNARFWAMLSDIARAKPEGRALPVDTWKCLFMAACGHQVRFEPGIDGGVVPVGFRSSRLTKEQFSELIDCIAEYGARHGVKFGDYN